VIVLPSREVDAGGLKSMTIALSSLPTAFVALANSLDLAIAESLIRKCDLYQWHRPGDRSSKWASGDGVMDLYLSDDRKCYAANSEMKFDPILPQ
jgi:hypothetical protein